METDPLTQLAAERNGNGPALAEHRNDAGNARRFACQHRGRLLYVAPQRRWLAWDGTRWTRDRDGAAMRAAKATAAAIYAEASRQPTETDRKAMAAWASSSESESRLRAMVALAQTEPGMSVLPEALDASPDVLSVANGTVDLRTGKLTAADPEALITRGSGVSFDPGATAPGWERFLGEVFAGDLELIAFAQRLFGYTLTGHTGEHVLPVLHGTGANGKSVTVGVARALLGDLAAAADFDSFTRARGDRGPRNDLARLDGARLVVASESSAGARLDESAVKQLTGGDVIAARFLYGEHFEFTPRFTLWMVSNHKPRVDGSDDAIWRRLRLIPFDVSFKGREDRQLAAKLEDELPGILNWALEGCRHWYADGLGSAGAVKSATAEYRSEEDTVSAFLVDRCERDKDATVPVVELRAAYEEFCQEQGERPLAGNVFGREMKKRGITRRGDGRRLYQGIGL